MNSILFKHFFSREKEFARHCVLYITFVVNFNGGKVGGYFASGTNCCPHHRRNCFLCLADIFLFLFIPAREATSTPIMKYCKQSNLFLIPEQKAGQCARLNSVQNTGCRLFERNLEGKKPIRNFQNLKQEHL